MESDEIIALTVHRRATEEEMAIAELVMKRPATGRTAQFSQPASAQSSAAPHHSDAATARVTVNIQTPTNPRPLSSARFSGGSRGGGDKLDTAHCTSQYLLYSLFRLECYDYVL